MKIKTIDDIMKYTKEYLGDNPINDSLIIPDEEYEISHIYKKFTSAEKREFIDYLFNNFYFDYGIKSAASAPIQLNSSELQIILVSKSNIDSWSKDFMKFMTDNVEDVLVFKRNLIEVTILSSFENLMSKCNNIKIKRIENIDDYKNDKFFIIDENNKKLITIAEHVLDVFMTDVNMINKTNDMSKFKNYLYIDDLENVYEIRT